MSVAIRSKLDGVLGRVSASMERAVVTLRLDQTLEEGIRELERAGISGAPVVDGEAVVGMVSLSDLFEAAGIDFRNVSTSGPWHRFERQVATAGKRVADAMRRPVVTLAPEASVAEAATLMRTYGINRIPIVDSAGRLVGIVARDEVIEAVARAALSLRGGGHHRPSLQAD